MNEKIQDELEDDLREEYDLSQLKNPKNIFLIRNPLMRP